MVATHPEGVADDRDRQCAGPIFSRQESTPESRLDTKHVEDPGTRAGAAHPLRLFTAGERESRWIVGGEAGERGRAAFKIEEVERRRKMFTPAVDVARRDRHEPIRLRMRQRPQQRRVDDAEDRQIDADPEREYGDDGRSARAAQPAH